MSLEEFENELTPRQKKYIMMQSLRDWGFGILYIGIAIMILFADKLKLSVINNDSVWVKIFAGIIILYGAFRIYRGIKKDYFIEKD